MSIVTYDVETTLTRVVRVSFDDAMIEGDVEDAVREFGEHPDAWPDYAEVIEDDLTLESIRKVDPAQPQNEGVS